MTTPVKDVKITVEGLPNSGKSVVAQHLHTVLAAAGFRVTLVDPDPQREPERQRIALQFLAPTCSVTITTAFPPRTVDRKPSTP